MNNYFKSFKIVVYLLFVLFCWKDEGLAQQKKPVLFAEGVINTKADEYGPTITPDGKTMFFVKRKNRKGHEFIYVSHLKNGKWSRPEIAEFSGKFYDKEPYISPDGLKLFFASKRPVNGKDQDFDIWVVEKSSAGWSNPQNLTSVNSNTYDNYPAVSANGTIYFSSTREDGKGKNDLYCSMFVDETYSKPVNIEVLNTPDADSDPYIDPDERFIIFSSTRSGGSGEGDLYISYHQNSNWTKPQNLGPLLNSTDYEYTPMISPDGKYFLFSRGWGDIYYIEIKALNLKIE